MYSLSHQSSFFFPFRSGLVHVNSSLPRCLSPSAAALTGSFFVQAEAPTPPSTLNNVLFPVFFFFFLSVLKVERCRRSHAYYVDTRQTRFIGCHKEKKEKKKKKLCTNKLWCEKGRSKRKRRKQPFQLTQQQQKKKGWNTLASAFVCLFYLRLLFFPLCCRLLKRPIGDEKTKKKGYRRDNNVIGASALHAWLTNEGRHQKKKNAKLYSS